MNILDHDNTYEHACQMCIKSEPPAGILKTIRRDGMLRWLWDEDVEYAKKKGVWFTIE